MDSTSEIDLSLNELEKIENPEIDSHKLDRDYLRELLSQTEAHGGQCDQQSDPLLWSSCVSVDEYDRVTGLNLTNRHLSGEIPTSLGKMSHLLHLNATSNALTGPIPEAIGGLSRLLSLRLGHNDISGQIPSALTRLSHLQALDLAWNRITGMLPPKLAFLTSLSHLSLGRNKLHGSIPKELGSLRLLTELHVRENKLAGKIPHLLGNLRSLTSLDLTSNSLQGHVPEALGRITALRELWLSDNQLVGSLPDTFSKLRALESLDVSRNKLSGKLTGRLFRGLSSLAYLNLSHNALEGDIPLGAMLSAAAGENTMREESDLSGGDSTSAGDHEPREIHPSEAPAFLYYLNLSHNQLSGLIPPDIGSFRSLETLDLSYNNLEGSIPSSVRGCASLRVLTLSHSGLCGELCSGELEEARAGCWRHLMNLESLRLDGNEFTGAVPAELGELRRLEVLQLQGNYFDGQLPWTLGKLDRLWYMSVRDNRISGRVPLSLGRLNRLQTLRLERNSRLRGPIPREITCRRPGCLLSADDAVLEDTEAAMLGARLGDWFLMPREAFLRMQELPGHSGVRASLLRYVSTVKPYECHVFSDQRGRRTIVRRREISFFSHCWDLPPGQCPPQAELLEGPYTDICSREKLRHMKACLEEAPKSIRYIWFDMLCVSLAEPTRRRAAGRSLPFFVQKLPVRDSRAFRRHVSVALPTRRCLRHPLPSNNSSGRFYILVADDAMFEKYKSRSWCRLEVMCAICPHQGSQAESAFSPQARREGPLVYNAVECFASLWNDGNRVETKYTKPQDLANAGLLGDAALGKISDEDDRGHVAEGALRVIDMMQKSGRLDPEVTQRWRSSCLRILYGSCTEALSDSSSTALGSNTLGNTRASTPEHRLVIMEYERKRTRRSSRLGWTS